MGEEIQIKIRKGEGVPIFQIYLIHFTYVTGYFRDAKGRLAADLGCFSHATGASDSLAKWQKQGEVHTGFSLGRQENSELWSFLIMREWRLIFGNLHLFAF